MRNSEQHSPPPQLCDVFSFQKCIFHGQTYKAPVKGDFSSHCAADPGQEEYHRQSGQQDTEYVSRISIHWLWFTSYVQSPCSVTDGSFWKRIGHLQAPAAHPLLDQGWKWWQLFVAVGVRWSWLSSSWLQNSTVPSKLLKINKIVFFFLFSGAYENSNAPSPSPSSRCEGRILLLMSVEAVLCVSVWFPSGK